MKFEPSLVIIIIPHKIHKFHLGLETVLETYALVATLFVVCSGTLMWIHLIKPKHRRLLLIWW